MNKHLEDLSNLVNELSLTNSTLEKKEILSKYKKCTELLYLIYSPEVQFNITSKNLIKRKDLVSNYEGGLFDLLDELSERKITGHEAISATNGFIQKNIEYEDLIYRILDKNLKVKIDAKVLNSVFPDLIEVFSVQLADKYEEGKIDFEKEEWYASRKLDGCLSGEVKVLLKNNGEKTLKEVVENKIDDEILSFDLKSNKKIFSKIIGYGIDIELKEDIEWYEIELEDGTKIKATSNHLFFMPDNGCYRRVDLLKEGDYLLK